MNMNMNMNMNMHVSVNINAVRGLWKPCLASASTSRWWISFREIVRLQTAAVVETTTTDLVLSVINQLPCETFGNARENISLCMISRKFSKNFEIFRDPPQGRPQASPATQNASRKCSAEKN